MAETWAERISWIVDACAGGSQRELGRRAGVSGQAVSAWVRGESQPAGEPLANILRAYPRLNPYWILTGVGPRERPLGEGGDGYAAGLLEVAQTLRAMAEQIEEKAGKRAGPDEAPGPDAKTSTSAASDRDFAREMSRASEAVSQAKRDRSSRRRA